MEDAEVFLVQDEYESFLEWKVYWNSLTPAEQWEEFQHLDSYRSEYEDAYSW